MELKSLKNSKDSKNSKELIFLKKYLIPFYFIHNFKRKSAILFKLSNIL